MRHAIPLASRLGTSHTKKNNDQSPKWHKFAACLSPAWPARFVATSQVFALDAYGRGEGEVKFVPKLWFILDLLSIEIHLILECCPTNQMYPSEILSHQTFVGNRFRFDSCVGTSLEFKPSCNHVWRLFGVCFRGSATAQRSCKRTGGSCKCLPAYSFLTTATAKTRVTSAVPSWYFSAPSAPSGSHTPLLLMLAQMRESGRR